MTMPDEEELNVLRESIGDRPDKCAKFETYVRLLADLDEDLDEGQDADKLPKLHQQIAAARRELDA